MRELQTNSCRQYCFLRQKVTLWLFTQKHSCSSDVNKQNDWLQWKSYCNVVHEFKVWNPPFYPLVLVCLLTFCLSPFIHLCTFLSVCLPACLPACLSVCPSVCLSVICLSVRLSVCLHSSPPHSCSLIGVEVLSTEQRHSSTVTTTHSCPLCACVWQWACVCVCVCVCMCVC